MVPLYLDDSIADRRLTRALRDSGLVVYLPGELGTGGASDERHLERAAQLGACLITADLNGEFQRLDARWRAEGRTHGGIIASPEVSLSHWVERVKRVGLLLTAELIRGHFLFLSLFADDETARNTVISLGGPRI